MRIEPRETIAGVPMLEIRALLRWVRSYGTHLSAGRAASVLRVDNATGDAIIAEFAARGWITPDKRRQFPDSQYKLTGLGARLAAAHATKPLKRATANKIFAGFQARVQEVNNSNHYLFNVSRIVLFGSYLGDNPIISDIDLVIHLAPKEARKRVHRRNCIARTMEYLHRGWKLGHDDIYVMFETLARREVLVYLRKRNSYLSFHSLIDEVVVQKQPHKVILGPTEYVIPDVIHEHFGDWDEDEVEDEEAEYA